MWAFGSKKRIEMKYIYIFIFSLIASAGFSQNKAGFTLEQLNGNPQDAERVCYSDGSDTLQGWKIHTYDAIDGYGFSIVDILGNEVVGGIELSPALCDYRPSECVESQEWTYGIDNTGTRFSDVADYQLTLSDGSTLQWSQTATSNWTPQLTEWATNIQAAADAAGLSWLVEPRAVNNPIPTDISGNYGNNPTGLPGAPSVPVAQTLISGGMVARYVNFQICPGQPVPVRAERLTSQTYTNNPYNLTSAGAVLGPTQKFFVCRDCGKEPTWYLEDGVTLASSGQIPFCYEPCGTLSALPPPPENDCAYEIDVACDNNNQTVQANFTNTITRRATVCNGEQIAVDYFQADPNDASALVVYTLVGSFVDCATGEAVPEPEPAIVIDECIKNEICVDGVSNGWQVKTITSDGKVSTTYEDQTGTIAEPTVWTIGKCDCGIIDYWTIDGVGGTLLERQWELTEAPASPFPSDATHGRGVREAHDFSLPTTVNTTTSSLVLNDANNAAGILDMQVIEGYIVVDKEIDARYSGTSEGYWAVELGACCGEFQLLNESGGFFSGRQMTFTLPVGIHKIRIWNIDSGASNSSATFGYTLDGGVTWINDNTPPNVSYSQTKPTQACNKGYLCDGKFYDLLKGSELVDVQTCKLECNPSCVIKIVD